MFNKWPSGIARSLSLSHSRYIRVISSRPERSNIMYIQVHSHTHIYMFTCVCVCECTCNVSQLACTFSSTYKCQSTVFVHSLLYVGKYTWSPPTRAISRKPAKNERTIIERWQRNDRAACGIEINADLKHCILMRRSIVLQSTGSPTCPRQNK